MDHQTFSELVFDTNSKVIDIILNSDLDFNLNEDRMLRTINHLNERVRETFFLFFYNKYSSKNRLDINQFINEIDSHLGNTILLDSHIRKLIYNQTSADEELILTGTNGIYVHDSSNLSDRDLVAVSCIWFKRNSEKILTYKSKEYASNVDRLHNFKKSYDLFHIPIPCTCLMYQMKHLTSVHDIVVQDVKVSVEKYREKIIDVYNYFLLLKGIYQDILQEEEHQKENKQ